VIRFSAALVAVAIGVLIGGIATSKLLLVYIAIVVSAVALLALAIGVVVKREELFGEGQGLVPAGAGAAPVPSAHAGESQDQSRPAAPVPPPAPFQGPAADLGAPFGAIAQAAPSGPASPPASVPSAPHQAPDGQVRTRGTDPVPPWEAKSARDQWSSSPRPASTTADPAPDWMPSGPSGPPAPSGAGPGTESPNWFAPKARPAYAAPPATDGPADAAPAGADDDAPASDFAPGDDTAVAAAPASVPSASDPSASELPASELPPAETAVPVAGDAEPEPGDAEPETQVVVGEPPSAGQAVPDAAAAMVAVLPGVPRYHQPDCVLIRFMPEDDVQLQTAAQARADGCTPCAACRPAG
jgi:hypothetical protein